MSGTNICAMPKSTLPFTRNDAAFGVVTGTYRLARQYWCRCRGLKLAATSPCRSGSRRESVLPPPIEIVCSLHVQVRNFKMRFHAVLVRQWSAQRCMQLRLAGEISRLRRRIQSQPTAGNQSFRYPNGCPPYMVSQFPPCRAL